MKRTSAMLISASLIMLVSRTAFAMPGAPLSANNNQFMPPSSTECQMSLSSPNVDYGSKSRWQLKEVEGSSQLLTPGKRQVSYSVICPFSQTIKIAVNGESTTGGNFRFGLNDKLRVTMISPQLDGHDVQFMTSTPDGILIDGPFNTLTLQPGQTFILVNGRQPAEGKSFNARIELEPVLSEQSARVATKQNSEANLSLELR